MAEPERSGYFPIRIKDTNLIVAIENLAENERRSKYVVTEMLLKEALDARGARKPKP